MHEASRITAKLRRMLIDESVRETENEAVDPVDEVWSATTRSCHREAHYGRSRFR